MKRLRSTDYQGDLDNFEQHLTNIPVGTTPIDLSIDGGVRPPSAPHAEGWKDVAGEANLDIQSALPIIYPQNVTIYQVDDRYYAHQVDYGYHGLEPFNDFLDAVSISTNLYQYPFLALTVYYRSMVHIALTLRSVRRATIQNTIQNIRIRTSMATRANCNAVCSSQRM